MSSLPRSVLVIGLGNGFRGDDATGLEVARRLADLDLQCGIAVSRHEGDGVALLDLWDGTDAVVLIDSVQSGAAPGTIHRIDASSTPVPLPPRGASTHALGVADAIELARTMDTLPSTLIVFGVEGASYETGSPLSDPVASVIDAAAGAVRREALELIAIASGTTSTGRLALLTTALETLPRSAD